MTKKLIDVFETGQTRSYPKGQIVLYQGEQTQNVFYIRSGYVKVYDITSQGNEKLMLILGPGDIFPLVWTFRGSDSLHYFYETFSDSELIVISREELTSSIKRSHQLTINLLEYFVDRTKDLMMRIDCIESSSSKFTIAQVLVYLAEAHGESLGKNTYKIPIKITHQSIADMAGTTRVTASTKLKELEEDNTFYEDGDSLVIHVDRIKQMFED